jgi:hypothetical protein
VVVLNKNINIKIKKDKKHILVYLKNELFLKQDYIKNKEFTLFLLILILSRFGFVQVKNKVKNKDVCI